MKKIRNKIWDLIEPSTGDGVFTGWNDVYDYTMIVVIIVSLVPLAFKTEPRVFSLIDKIAACYFAVDYLLRWLTYDIAKPQYRGFAFLLYPFTPMALIDLLSILPSLHIISAGFRILKVFRLMRTLRVFRAMKFVRYSKNIQILSNVLTGQKKALGCVAALAGAYVLLSALLVFNVEPDTFKDYFEAIYWATVSLTTMGYGDIYPVTTLGRIVTMASSFVGIAIVALPAGIITAGYMDEIKKVKSAPNEEHTEEIEK